MRAMIAQAIRAARLDRGAYRGLLEAPDAILHALGTVVLAGIAAGLGVMGVLVDVTELAVDAGSFSDRLVGLWLWIMTAMVGWVIWGVSCYLLGSRFLGGGAEYRLLLRALGICYGPAVLLTLIAVPWVGAPASAIGIVWVLVAGVVAVREIQDVDWLGAALSTIPGWFLSFLVLPVAFLGSLGGGG